MQWCGRFAFVALLVQEVDATPWLLSCLGFVRVVGWLAKSDVGVWSADAPTKA